MFGRARPLRIESERLLLRLPRIEDHVAWAKLRIDGENYLAPWEPIRSRDHLTRGAFRTRCTWAARSARDDKALPLFIFDKSDETLMGAITLDNIQRGPAQFATIGYWMGQPFIRNGYMQEAVRATVAHAFGRLDLSRVQAGCLPENAASRRVLEKSGFKYEGVAQNYLRIAGEWRTHVLYAALREDRRGKG
ncbi:GNAT family protein [Roseobacter sp. HKCCA0434]|uniref:GNAT family N-acetyltransferase n=1 Tax=Roseobacter sp. HKCCA0434 TaxID=3079297 RepID=UPI0029058604|nr:GNAT family protein [Roseobacter sp. HKCCA0434]